MIAALLLAALAQSTPPAPARGGVCIEATQQPDWVPLDDHTILVTSGLRRFKVTTDTCPPLHRAFPVVRTDLLGGTSICSPQDVRLFVSSGGEAAPMYCSIRSITPLSETEVKALGERRR